MNKIGPTRQLYIMMRRTTVVMLLILLATFVIFYLTVPKYRFDQPQAFNGSFIYNPYDSIQPELWRKYNFNTQANSWGGFPDGRKFSGEMIDSIYQLLGYDHITISDYQKINKFGNQLDRFLPSYKHGYGWNMPQQICIGAEEVMWLDYPFHQTLEHKQSIIDKLSADSRLIALTHPVHENGYDLVDMKHLSGYHLIEILNNKAIYTEHWDTALSNGHRIYLLANDHSYKVLSTDEMGKRFTMVNAQDLQMETIIDALEKGKVYGVDLFKAEEITNSDTSAQNDIHPMLIAATMKSDTFCVEVDRRAAFFRFIGQNGKDLSIIEDSTKARYLISPEDTYVRTEITFLNGAVMYLNPITRHATSEAERQVLAQIDHTKTAIYRGIYIVAIVFVLQMIFKWQMRKIRMGKND